MEGIFFNGTFKVVPGLTDGWKRKANFHQSFPIFGIT